MIQKLTAHETDIFRRILKAEARTMYRNKSPAFFYKSKQCFFLLGRDFFMICIDHQAVILIQVVSVEIIGITGIRKINSFLRER